jgi:hypothetical protein
MFAHRRCFAIILTLLWVASKLIASAEAGIILDIGAMTRRN